MTQNKIRFRDYKNYPAHLMDACRFRDDYDELPDGAFLAVAREKGLEDLLVEFAEWESEQTDVFDESEDT